MPSSSRQPTIERRSHRRTDGTTTDSWCVRYYDVRGVRRRRSFPSVEEAEFERARLALEAVTSITRAATVVPDEEGSMLLRAFWQIWLADAESRLHQSTVRDHVRTWTNRVEPRFGDFELRQIKPRMVAQWRAELLARGVGAESVRKAMGLLQAIYTVALEWGEATSNPVKVVRKPRQGRRRVVAPLPPEAVEAIRARLLRSGHEPSGVLVSVLAYAGLRPGEALALEVRHLRERTLLIEQAVSHGVLKEQKTGREYRTVDLFGVLREELLAWIAVFPNDPNRLIFGRPDGMPWRLDDWNNWRARAFQAAARDVGLGQPRPYDLRHSFASLLMREQRVSIVDLAEQLGHAPTMTLDTYSHVMREYRGAPPVDAEDWIRRAREEAAAR